MESILTSVKQMLGITPEHEYFDVDIIMHINTVFMILTQLGVGPSKGFRIKDSLAIWSDFIPDDDVMLEPVKTYMGLKVRLLFDPPASSAVTDSINRAISELEWRLYSEADYHSL